MLRSLLIASNAITLALLHYEYTKKRHLEGRLFRMKLSPHFIFNRLSDVHSRYFLLDAKASETILDIVACTRYQIRHIDDKLVPLPLELEHIRECIDSFSKGFDSSTEIIFHYSNESDENLYILPCLFDDVLYNCFKYAKRKNGYIFISITVDSKQKLHLHCINNYEYHKRNSSQNGIGILVKLLHIYYPHRHSIKTSLDVEYYRIDITLKLP